MTPKELMEICLNNKDRDRLIFAFPKGAYLDKSFSAGELKDKLSELTSLYSYYGELFSVCEHVMSSLDLFIEKHSSILRNANGSPYKSKSNKRDQDDKVKFIQSISDTCCGVIFKGRDIQYFSELMLSVEYIRDYVKQKLLSIDKSISVGNTVLSYEKLELKNLGVV